MSKFRMLLFAVIGILMSSMTVFAQAGSGSRRQRELSQQVSRVGGGHRFRDRGVWWRVGTVAHWCGGV